MIFSFLRLFQCANCNLQVLARARHRLEDTGREWHADRCAALLVLPLPPLLFELLPLQDDWQRVCGAANPRARWLICIKWPHAIGLVRAAAHRLACRDSCLLLWGPKSLKIDQNVRLSESLRISISDTLQNVLHNKWNDWTFLWDKVFYARIFIVLEIIICLGDCCARTRAHCEKKRKKQEAKVPKFPVLSPHSPTRPGSVAARSALLFVPAGLIEQRVTDGPRGCWPISSLPRAQWVRPACHWLKRVWERMQRGFHTNWEHARRL